ncbi:fibrobacter succinogenes major paralogous domain-containing protein [Cognataquiflexum rubidum]|uniref:fibrobacter succinogenes major paralogous domain-containing protein n=1 Tax=Cognataquiflexum rubidum TaxID=2922273 RepID=UPI001F13889E|nr:fibrobacter succinogenes major paralogous domain-containing protein [Cognataquiflexum rubidum]MCH6235044.1 fibrobacter succinogenes major paralogous domain-containing protein [Cognataquiflexum rubidum]
MKNLTQIFLLAVFSTFLLSCKETEEPLQILPPVAGGEWVIYQLAKIHAPDIPVKDNSFSGSLGNVEINLVRIPGDTLIFIIPDVGSGPTELTVTMGRQIRDWNLTLNKWPNPTFEIFFDRFLKNALALQKEIQEVDELKEMAIPFGLWMGFFTQKLQSLSDIEKEAIAGTFRTINNFWFFENPHVSFELPCRNGPEYTVASMSYRFVSFDISYLKHFSKLPKTPFHEAVVAGFGLSFWYQKILLEYYAQQTLLCPVIQDVQLIESSTGKILQPSDIVSIEPLKPISFRTIGTFRRITKTDIEQGVDALFTPTYGFRRKALLSKYFSNWIQSYIEDYKWELPILNERSLVFAPDEAPTTTGPVHGQSWLQPFMNNSDVRLAENKYVGDSLTLKFENYLGDPLPFNLKLELWASSFKKVFEVSAVLQTGCPLTVDLLMIGRTHFLDIVSGLQPYEIAWSNGVLGDLSQTLSPGNYDIKVADADGCERTIPFTVPEFGTVEDIDGNVYETVKIGNTWWMTENLRTTRKKDGTAIQLIEPNAAWSSAAGPAYSWKGNDSGVDEKYGKLYNYPAACCDICPEGWRLPGIAEFSSLSGISGIKYGKHMKEVNGWPLGSLKSTNLSGLRILPSGARSGTNGDFGGLAGELATFWTSAKDAYGLPQIGLLLGSSDSFLVTFSTNSRDGLSVRCVK